MGLGSKLYQNPDWFKQKHLEEGWNIYRMARECGVSWDTIRYWGRKHGIPLQKHGTNDKQYPNLELSPELAYILGVIDGDGCVSGDGHIQLNAKDYVFAKEFEKALKAIGLRAKVTERNDWNKNLERQYHGWKCYAYSTVFVHWYNGLTQEQKEGIVRQFPEQYLKGFFESEGSYYLDTNGSVHVYFSNFDYDLLLMVQRLLTLLGYDSNIYESKHKGYFTGREVTSYRLSLLGPGAKKHEFIKRLNPCIKNRPYDYRDPNGLRGRRKNPKEDE